MKASIVLKQEMQLEPLEIGKWCELRLAYFAGTRYAEFLSELPHIPNGKIQKYVLRGRGADGAFDREAAGCEVKR